MGLRSRIGRGLVRDTLPRTRPQPETGIIQSPELVRAIQQRMGIRQHHVVPLLADTVQPVIVVDDVSSNARTIRTPWMAQVPMFPQTGVLIPHVSLFNRAGSGRRLILKRIMITVRSAHTDIFNIGTGGVPTGAANPIATGTGRTGYVRAGTTPIDVIPPDILQAITPLAAGVLLAGESSSIPPASHFEHAMFPASEVFRLFVYEPKVDIFIYPDAAVTWWPDGSTTLIWDSSAEWEEETIRKTT